MKSIKFIILFVISTLSFSQQSGKIEYSLFVKLREDIEEVVKNLKGAEDISLSEGAEELSFVLEFKNCDLKFYVIDGIETKDLDAKVALAWAKYQNVNYCNLKDKIVCYNNKNNTFFHKEEFAIEKKVFDSWELKNEKKEIQGFTCYKAVGFYIANTNRGEEKKEVVAWYCPELPFSFGPNGYAGLPGLILELQNENALFGVTKISLNEKIEDIDSTKLKGKKITAEEYSKILRERAGIIMEGR